jgi:predicted nucleotidyltransferase
VAQIVASDNALGALLAVAQRPEGLRASETARILGSSYTGAEKALEILAADGLTTRQDHRHRLAESPRAREAIRFALAFLDAERVLTVLAHANPAVEFCGLDGAGVLFVVRRFADPSDEAHLRDAVEMLTQFQPTIAIESVERDDIRARLLEDVEVRRRAQNMRVLAGSVDRTFPDPTRHGDFDAPQLGGLSPALVTPSRRRLRQLARRYHLGRILAFGSATREDFSPGSDLDLLVEPAPGHHLSLGERINLVADAERLFDRDVDLLIAPVRRPSLAERVRREAVVLHDAT